MILLNLISCSTPEVTSPRPLDVSWQIEQGPPKRACLSEDDILKLKERLDRCELTLEEREGTGY